MVKLNKKGYMLVEIVIASVLTFGIAYYLLNLTYKFKNINEDIYQSVYYGNDKMLITKNIMSDLEKGTVTDIQESADGQTIEFSLYIQNTRIEKRKLMVTKVDGKTKIQYGKITMVDGVYIFDKTNISYYEKDLETTLIVGDLEMIKTIGGTATNGLAITIPIHSIYDDKDYSIKLFANRLARLDLGFYIDHIWYSEGYPGNGIHDLKISIKVNNEYIDEKEYIGDFCRYYPINSKVEIKGITYNETPINYEKNEFTLEKDTNIWMSFTNVNGTLQFNGQQFYDYKTTDGTCL